VRIAVVMEYHPYDKVGGSEVQVFEVAKALAALGHHVTYVCQRYDRTKAVEEDVDGVQIVRALQWHKVFRFLVGPRLWLAIRRARPDVVYQRFASPLTGLAALSARSLGVPFVWGCSEDVTLERGHLRRGTPTPTQGLVPRLKWAVLMANAALSDCLFTIGVRMARALIVQNAAQAELLWANYRRRGGIIPNGIRAGEPHRAESPRPLVLWLNSIRRVKRPEAFIQLARALAAVSPEVEFAMVGGRQDDDYKHATDLLASEVPSVELYGAVPHAETRSWFERAWVFVLTSYGEGFPNVILQAWAAGTPVVSLTVDPDGLLRSAGLGLVSETEDQLALDVRRLLEDEAERRRLGEAGRAYVVEHFDIGAIAARYEALFARLASSQPEEPAA
jgi:glycosyltransferase involved in cell wall biosynthesis